ncbi:MAG: asparagine synthase-related protein [Rhizomicrobium sp.]
MTAIAGVWRLGGRSDAAPACARMLAAQKIYGPDRADQWDDGFIAVGRALFRLLPEDVHDTQPLVGSAGNLVLVADIRLDNRDDLIAALGLSQPSARRLCDAAILLAAFERWDAGCLDRIVGDFAFAVWDLRRRRLVLARDPLGQRPLHYHRAAGLFAFATMPKGLHALAEIPRAPDEDRVAEFVVLLPESGSPSYFAGIERVEPGHVVTVDAKGLASRRYWEPSRPIASFKTAGDYEEGLRHYVDLAMRSRLRGVSGTVATHLSAGLDSSIVTATAARQMALSGGRVVAFTAVPRNGHVAAPSESRIGDEGPLAASTAALHPNIDHVAISGDPAALLAELDRYFFLFEQPVRDLPNGAWICAINDAIRRRKIAILLPAYMGNLTLSYNGFERLAQEVGRGRWLSWYRECAAVIRSGHMSRLGALAASFGPQLPAPLWLWLKRVIAHRDLDVRSYTGIHPERLVELDLAGRARSRDLDFAYRPRKDGFATRLWALRRVDMGNVNKGTLAGWGIDQRDPTTDRRLVEFCLGVPAEQFLSNGVTRALARRAFADRVPDAVLNERRRGRQGADWHEGVNAARVPIAAEIARLGDCAAAVRTLDLARLHGLAADWPRDGWERDSTELSYRIVLLRALAVGHFLRKAGGGNM